MSQARGGSRYQVSARSASRPYTLPIAPRAPRRGGWGPRHERPHSHSPGRLRRQGSRVHPCFRATRQMSVPATSRVRNAIDFARSNGRYFRIAVVLCIIFVQQQFLKPSPALGRDWVLTLTPNPKSRWPRAAASGKEGGARTGRAAGRGSAMQVEETAIPRSA
jgi:hypothetical protein